MMPTPNFEGLNKTEHQEVWNLLPWYVNGSLESNELFRVKNHIKTCITCRIEIKQQQLLYDRMQHTDFMQQASQTSFAQLKKRLNKPVIFDTNTENGQVRSWSGFFSLPIFGLTKYAAMSLSAFLVVLLFIFGLPINQPEPGGEYRTLANPSETKQRDKVIRVIFVEELDAGQIESILKNVSGEIVKGPSHKDIYEVQIGRQLTDSQELIDVISQLRQNPLVVFAEPAQVNLSLE